jgi:hypothetical protein
LAIIVERQREWWFHNIWSIQEAKRRIVSGVEGEVVFQ